MAIHSAQKLRKENALSEFNAAEQAQARANIGVTSAAGGSITGDTTGVVLSKALHFAENATNTLHTGTVVLPAGAVLHDIQVDMQALWTATGAVTMKIGDTADDDGYFTGINCKATDIVLGEQLRMSQSTLWGGKEGAYIVAVTGRRGPTSTNFGGYYVAGSNITAIITVGTPATTVGRTIVTVTYSVGQPIAPVLTGP